MTAPPRESIIDLDETGDFPTLPYIKNAFEDIRSELISLGVNAFKPFKHTEMDMNDGEILTIDCEYHRNHFPDNEIYSELLDP